MSRPYPLDAVGRAAAREANRLRLIAQAEGAARIEGFSLNCAGRLQCDTHPADEPGCANQGDGCLCQCHDGPA